MKFYSVVKYEIKKFVGKQIELENITISEITQTQKDNNFCMVYYLILLAMNLLTSEF